MGAIYSITSPSGKMYIGSARDCKKRWRDHAYELRNGSHHSKKLQNAWNKYRTLEYVILEEVPDDSQLLIREQVWMDRYDVFKTGYNMTPDARSGHGHKHSQETKDLISGYNLLRRDQISATHKGKTISEEHKEALRAANLGTKRSDEHKKLQGDAIRAFWKSDAGIAARKVLSDKAKAQWEAKRAGCKS